MCAFLRLEIGRVRGYKLCRSQRWISHSFSPNRHWAEITVATFFNEIFGLATAKSNWASKDYVKLLKASVDAARAATLSCALAKDARESAISFSQQELAARIAKARDKANTAMKLSLWGMFCFAPLSIAGLVLGIQALSEFKQGQDRQGKGKAIAAVLIGGIDIIFRVFPSLAGEEPLKS